MTDLWHSLTLAEKFQWGATLSASFVLLMLAAIVFGSALLAAAMDMHRELFEPQLEDEEAKLVTSRQRRRELDAAALGVDMIDADSLDGRRLNEILTTMPSPRHAQTRIHCSALTMDEIERRR